jgi:hypothetical protein
MSRPDTDLPLQYPHPDDPDSIIQAIQELSSYQIHRTYRDVKTKTANYTMDPVLDRIILADGTSNTVLITLPSAAEADYTEYVVKAIDITSAVTVNTVATDGTLDGVDINATPVTLNPVYNSIRVCSDGTNWFRTDVAE